jgi:hypothetical protein
MALMSSIIHVEPYIFEEEANQKVWQDAMVEEYTSIMRSDVWDIMSRLEGKSIVSSRWLYKIKHVADMVTSRISSRGFMVRGFSEKEGVEYRGDIFSSNQVCLYSRCYFYCFMVMRWRIHDMDVKTDFLSMGSLRRKYI